MIQLMNFLCILIFSVSIIGCKQQQKTSTTHPADKNRKYTSGIFNQEEIKKDLFIFASDSFQGREAGTEGEKKAIAFITDFYQKNGIQKVPGMDSYTQKITKGTYPRLYEEANNVMAFVEGSDKKEEIIVISAHLDHLGEQSGKIYNGADDDGSGTIAVLQLAKQFQKLKAKGKSPRRSLLFLNVTGEEKGLYGSHYFTRNAPVNLRNVITNLNIDMIGRVDEEHKQNPRYLYLIGSDKLSVDLKDIALEENKAFNFTLDFRYDEPNDPNRYYYRSDHYNFAKQAIPVIFFFNGTHEDYHQPTDTPDKINYPIFTERIEYIYQIANNLANRDFKPRLNVKI